ncbi:DUF2793 domain-containing protein [Paracoccus sp. Z330]|uniref:DUF2793 domain-containing protein n=1 Tax=Paracoccus onchidii TaxID=3017813 RepID=A0ABT4ZFL9_9RHOB|nr:DUF2793 domain-containing protein [Paracoccus onchidii]MDB6178039.1 DUF2793 domain-containing protein [Paracoccus onchidii]
MPTNETTRFAMPLLQAAQAQKHVTVNEALMRLDGVVNLVLQSTTSKRPPDVVFDGQCWAVPAGALSGWTGQDGLIAVGSNGGWQFVPPSIGMRAFVVDQGVQAIHDGLNWVVGAVTAGVLGSGLDCAMAEADFTITSGMTIDTPVTIPAGVMVIGAVARVKEAITGSLSSWRLGTDGANDRFGQGLGTARNSWARGILGAPMTYYQPATLQMRAEGGDFTGGRVSLAVHWLSLRLPM